MDRPLPNAALPDPSTARPLGLPALAASLAAIPLLGFGLCVLLGLAVFLIASLVVGLGAAEVRVSNLREALMGDPQMSETLALAASVLLYAAVALVVLLFARLRGGARWRDLVALRPWSLRQADWRLWALLGGTLAYSLAADAALAYFYPSSQKWVELPATRAAIALFVVVAVIAAPLTEELIFRGWLYTGLRARLGLRSSLVISAACFALAHWERTHLYALAVFPVGLALGLVRERAGSIKASALFHASYNGLACLLLLAER